jgi:hypothetical protein
MVSSAFITKLNFLYIAVDKDAVRWIVLNKIKENGTAFGIYTYFVLRNHIISIFI